MDSSKSFIRLLSKDDHQSLSNNFINRKGINICKFFLQSQQYYLGIKTRQKHNNSSKIKLRPMSNGIHEQVKKYTLKKRQLLHQWCQVSYVYCCDSSYSVMEVSNSILIGLEAYFRGGIHVKNLLLQRLQALQGSYLRCLERKWCPKRVTLMGVVALLKEEDRCEGRL